jgi:hypothetical protein
VTFLNVLVRWPLLALVPAALLYAFARWCGHALAWGAASAWFVYAVYELLVQRRVLCSGDCDIRVDLLLIYPALGGLSLLALVAGSVRVRQSRRRPSS